MNLANLAVIVPCYRCADTLPRAVHSILDDAPSDLQLILVDDGSGDDTLSVCRALAAQDKRIRVLQRPNGGASAARNTGLDAVPDAEWVMFVDSDDELFCGLWQELRTADVPPDCGMALFGFRADSGFTSAGQLPVGGFSGLPALGTAFFPCCLSWGCWHPLGQNSTAAAASARCAFTKRSKSTRTFCSTCNSCKRTALCTFCRAAITASTTGSRAACPAACAGIFCRQRQLPARSWRVFCAKTASTPRPT